MKRVIQIEDKSIKEKTKVKVAAYCRVSTDHIDQNGSIGYQISHFENLIKSNSEWEFVEIYSDIGSGLRVKNRPGYMKMIKDGNKKKFDLVFVKSLSRLGRDSLQVMKLIRRWREMGIGIISELEQINTLEDRDFMIDIALAVAQDCSRAKSNNIKFGIRQRMREGKTILNHTQFLGYTKGTDGTLIVVPEEAKIVKKIFELYLQGNGVRKIKRYLEEKGIKTVTGKSEWSTATIDRMLSNEKYMGQVIMQKTCTPDFLTGKQVKNKGQETMCVVENAHKPIIDKETFEKVQERKRY